MRLARAGQAGDDDEARGPRGRRVGDAPRARGRASQLLDLGVVDVPIGRAASSRRSSRSASSRAACRPRDAQQLVARRDLDEHREVAAGRDRHRHERHRHAEHLDVVATSRPSRSYSRPLSQRSSWTTSSTRLDDRVADTPNRSVTLTRPRPRISTWCRVSSGQRADQDRLRRGSGSRPCRRRRADGRARRDRARTRSCRCRSRP